MRTFDLVVVGAGVVGAACAEACATGRIKVLVVDKGGVGGGVTAAGMGHLVAMDDSSAQLALTDYSCRLWRALAAEGLPAALEYDACGTLWVAADADEMAEVVRKKQVCDAHAVAAEVWDATRLSREEPNLRKGLSGALYVSGDGVVYPPAAAAFLLERARGKGAELRLGAEVERIDLQENVVRLKVGGDIVLCRKLLLAAGCATPDLMRLVRDATRTAHLDDNVPVKKRKGHLVITDRYPGFVKHQLVELGYLKSAHSVTADSVAFNIQPRKTGQMLIGSSRQYDADGLAVDGEIVAKMILRAEEYLPGVGQLQAIRVWTGHRPATPGKLPLIGPSAQHEQIWLATGHEGLGITTSLGTGQLVADMMLGRRPEIDPKPYLPARFAREGAGRE